MAATAQVVGEAGIIIKPITAKFESDLQSMLNRAGNSAFQIPVTIGTGSFEEGLAKIKGQAESGITIPVGAGTGAAENAVGAVKGQAEAGADMPLVINATMAELTIGSLKGQAEAGATMPVGADTTSAEQALGAIKAQASAGVQMPLDMGGGPGGAAEQISGFGNAIATAGGFVKQYGLQAAGALGLTYGFGRAMSQVKSSVFGFNQQLEGARIGFETMFGSAELANQKIEEFKIFARQTPFEFPDILTGAQRLKSFGFETEAIVPMLTNIGDASAALGQGSFGIEKIIRALGQMQAKGKAAGEEFLQLQEIGIPAMQYISEATGKTTQELFKLQQKGLLDSKTAIDAILAGLGKNFGGLMAKQAQTFQGAMSNVKDSINQVLASIGEPLYKKIAAAGVSLGNFLSDISKAFGEGGFKKAFDVLAESIGGPLEGTVRSVTDNLYELTNSIKQIVSDLSRGILPVLLGFGAGLVAALRGVLNVLEPVVSAIANASPIVEELASAVAIFVVVSKVSKLGIVTALSEFVVGAKASVAAATQSAAAQERLAVAEQRLAASTGTTTAARTGLAAAYQRGKAQAAENIQLRKAEAAATVTQTTAENADTAAKTRKVGLLGRIRNLGRAEVATKQASAAATAVNATAVQAETVAETQNAVATNAATQAEIRQTIAMQSQGPILAALYGATQAATLSEGELAVATNAATVAIERQNIATGRLAGVQAAQAVTSKFQGAAGAIGALGAKMSAALNAPVGPLLVIVGILAAIKVGASQTQKVLDGLQEKGAKTVRGIGKTEIQELAASNKYQGGIGDTVANRQENFNTYFEAQKKINAEMQKAAAIASKGDGLLGGLSEAGATATALLQGRGIGEYTRSIEEARGKVEQLEKQQAKLDKEFAKQTVGWGRLSVAIGDSGKALENLGAKKAATPEQVLKNTADIQQMLEASFRAGNKGNDPNSKQLAAIAKQAQALGQYDLPSLQAALAAAGIDLKTFTGSSADLAAKLDEAASATKRATDAAVGIGPAMSDAAAAIDKAKKNASTFTEALFAQTNFFLDGVKAQNGWTDSLGELNNASSFTASALDGLASSANAQVQAAYAQAEVNAQAAGSLDVVGDASRAAGAKQQELYDQFVTAAMGAGKTRAEAETLATALLGIPGTISIQIQLQGAQTALSEAQQLLATLQAAKGEKLSIIGITIATAAENKANQVAAAQANVDQAAKNLFFYTAAANNAAAEQKKAQEAAKSQIAADKKNNEAKQKKKEQDDAAKKAAAEAKRAAEEAQRAQEERVRKFLEAVKRLQDGTESMKNSFAGIVTSLQQRRQELMGNLRERTQTESGVSVARIIKNTQERTKLLAESQRGLSELQNRGLSADAIKSLGLTGTAEQAKVIRRLLKASPDELRKLSSQVGTLSETAQQAAYREQGTIIAEEIRKALDSWVEAGGQAKLSVGDISTIIQNSKGDPKLIAAGIADKLGGVAKR